MAITRVTGSHAQQANVESASARTLAFGGAISGASLKVCAVAFYNVVTLTVSDSVDGAYTLAGTVSAAGGGPLRCAFYYKENATGSAAPTVTVTPSGSAYVTMSLDEFTGVKTSSPVEDEDNSSNNASTLTTATTTATVGNLVLAMVHADSSQTASSVNAPFALSANIGGSGAGEGIQVAYDLSAPGNEACTFNMTGSTDATMAIASFLAAPASSARTRMSLLGVG